MSAISRRGLAWAGLEFGALAWAISTQANYALADWSCSRGLSLASIVALACLFVAAASGLVSLWVWSSASDRRPNEELSGSDRFIAMIAALSALLFSLTIILQGAAALVLSGCER